MAYNVIQVSFGGSRKALTAPINYRDDIGQVLKIKGLALPTYYVVDFCNEGDAQTKPMTGTVDGVSIPDEFLATGKPIKAYIVLSDENSTQTRYEVTIPVNPRPRRTDIAPTPAEQQAIDELIAAMNDAVEDASDSATAAAGSATDAGNSATAAHNAQIAAEAAQSKAETAQGKAEDAQEAAETAQGKAEDAQAAAEAALAEFTEITVSAETLEPGSPATADYENGHLTLGIPEGEKGDQGDQGVPGQAATIAVGTTTTLQPGADATVQNSGTSSAAVFDFGIPKGEKGDPGTDGVSPTVTVETISGGHEVTITDKNGNHEFNVMDGIDGTTFTPSVSNEGVISWSNDGGKQNPTPVNIKGPKGDTGEVSQAEFETALDSKAPVIIDSASGAIASFPDGADGMPVHKLVVNLSPKQDLHGYGNPWPAGGGVNKWDEQTELGLLNSDGSVSEYSTRLVSSFIPVVSGETYAFCWPSNSGRGRGAFYDANKNLVKYEGDFPPPITTTNVSVFTVPENACYLRFNLTSNYGATYNHDVSINYPSTVVTYSPFANICPISGWDGVTVEHTGKSISKFLYNTFSSNTYYNGYAGFHNGWKVADRTLKYTYSIFIDNRGASSGVSCAAVWFTASDRTTYVDGIVKSGNSIAAGSAGFSTVTVDMSTLPNTVYLMCGMRLQIGGIATNPMLQVGSNSSPYEPYNGNVHSVNLGETVYGAKPNLISGGMPVTKVKLVFDGSNDEIWTPSSDANPTYFAIWNNPASIGNDDITQMANWLIGGGSNYTPFGRFRAQANGAIAVGNLDGGVAGAYHFATREDFKTFLASNPLEICYEIATPTQAAITPTPITALKGENVMWSDGDSVEVEYCADTKLYIEKLTQPTEDDMIADHAISAGTFFMIGNTLYLATAQIAAGATITPGTNATRLSLADALNQLNT